jgi:hypothetical protein
MRTNIFEQLAVVSDRFPNGFPSMVLGVKIVSSPKTLLLGGRMHLDGQGFAS